MIRRSDLERVVLTFLLLRLPHLSPEGRAIIECLVRAPEAGASLATLASAAGLSRNRLRFVALRDGLPHPRVLYTWFRLIGWMVDHELSGTALSRLALSDGEDTGYRFRVVKRLTGADWTQVKSRGTLWVLDQLIGLCPRPDPDPAFEKVEGRTSA